ncbi:MAG: calcium-binding protein [Pirellulaceae bacterium]
MDSVTSAASTDGGNDTIFGGNNDDVLLGADANDQISGDAGHDMLVGDFATVISTGGIILRTTSTQTNLGGTDSLFGNDGSDTLLGGAAADSLDSGSDGSFDILIGDSAIVVANDGSADANSVLSTGLDVAGGADNIVAMAGSNLILGGIGNDTIQGGVNDDWIAGDLADVRLDGSNRINRIESVLFTDGGDDSILSGSGPDAILAGTANDFVQSGSENDVVVGDAGVIIAISGVIQRVESTQQPGGGNDNIDVGSENDIAFGGTANDTIHGGANGDDILLGDHGLVVRHDGSNQANDILTTGYTTGGGMDIITDDDGNNTVIGGDLQDDVTTGPGQDLILGDYGDITKDANDLLEVATTIEPSIGGNDTIASGEGADSIIGGTANDSINSSQGEDIAIGDAGTLRAIAGVIQRIESTEQPGGGNDYIDAGTENDIVLGGTANDTIIGGTAGDDILLGDHGLVVRHDGTDLANDILTTGYTTGGGQDIITDDDGNNTVVGGDLEDDITTGPGHDLILGDYGDITKDASDLLEVATTIDPAIGGNDTIVSAAGNDSVIGGTADDLITTSEGEDIVIGDAGTLTAAAGVIHRVESTEQVGGGNDNIDVGSEDDIAFGGTANDTIHGGANGDDILLGDHGLVVRHDGSPQANDIVTTGYTTGGGMDTITDADGNNTVVGGDLEDNITTGPGHDLILGDYGDITKDTNDLLEVATTIDPHIGSNGTSVRRAETARSSAAQPTVRSLRAKGEDVIGDASTLTAVAGGDPTVSTEQAGGGNDGIDVGSENDIALGGTADTIHGGANGDDILLGDHGLVVRHDRSPQANDILTTGYTTGGGQDIITDDDGSSCRRWRWLKTTSPPALDKI